jgi:glycosyltransferase involved in cell wall biosynthesis
MTQVTRGDRFAASALDEPAVYNEDAGVIARSATSRPFVLAMTASTISVAMCTYNGENFLSEQLDSIARQSRLPDELVICDDGSSDRSQEIVRQFAQYTPIPVIFEVNEQNLRSTKNFEKAIGLCRSSIVTLADQDDVWYEHKLSKIEATFAGSDNVAAVFSDADLIDEQSRPLGLRLWPTFSFDAAKQRRFAEEDALSVLVRHPVVTGATMAFRRDLFDQMTPIPAHEVHDQWMSFLLAAAGNVALIPEPLMQYRRHEKQQLGPGPLDLRSRMVEARGRGESFYLQEIERYRTLESKLQQNRVHFSKSAHALREIKRKLNHLEHRARLSRVKVARIPKVLREVVNGNYWRYSGGWVSIAKDMIIR